ncbi:MAG: anthranilate phosphoribosyltransferase [Gammaproteobacteria bacterium]|nr:anthranilate phosphoribosyltransferase [Gammaproteobacteria bacterium]
MTITPHQALQRTIEHREIFFDEMLYLMRMITRNEISTPVLAAIITGLRVKKETIGEITAAATVLRELSIKVAIEDTRHLVDVVGTGGDGSHTFNISTCAMLVAAAAGAKVSKHGGRGVSSTTGSADVLQALGVNIHLPPEAVSQSIEQCGLGFMFAPQYHPAMKVVSELRKELGIKTIFNILGPLTNPANAPNIFMGVFHADLVGIQVRVLQRLGVHHALVIYGTDGIDEATLGGSSVVAELQYGQIREYQVHPEDYGLTMGSSRNLRVKNAQESADIIVSVLQNTPGLAKEITRFNAAFTLYAANVVTSIENGLELAESVLSSGKAMQLFLDWRAFTQKFVP